MEITVKVDQVSLADVVRVTYDGFELETATLGDVVVAAILDRLRSDAGWDALAARFSALVDERMGKAAPGYIEALVASEVTRQLSDPRQGAVTRGEPSTKAQAVVATEVTTQLRAQFVPVVEAALGGLRRELDTLAQEMVTEFRRSMGGAG